MTTEVANQDFIAEELKKYNLADAEIAKKAKEYLSLKIINIDDKEGYQVVKKAGLEMRSWRTGIEKTRKGLKQHALDYGRAVDGEAKRLTLLMYPIEKHLVDERTRIDEEQARIEFAAKMQKQLPHRLEKLASIGIKGNKTELLEMDDAKFFVWFSQKHDEHLETQRLKQEKEQAKLDKERQMLEAAKQAVRDEKQWQADIKAAEEKAAQDERERIERERDAEVERQRQAKADEEAKAAAAPDKEKLNAFADAIDAVTPEEVQSEKSKQIITNAIGVLNSVTQAIRNQTADL